MRGERHSRAAATLLSLALGGPLLAQGNTQSPSTAAPAEQDLAARLSALAKPASEATRQANARVLTELPFADRQDFTDARRGLIAPLHPTVVSSEAGQTVWDLDAYTKFVSPDTPAPDTVNPSLW